MDTGQTTRAAQALAMQCARREGALQVDVQQGQLAISRWQETFTLQLTSAQKPLPTIIRAIEKVFAIQPGNATTTPLPGYYITQWNGTWTVHDSRS